MSVFYQTGGQCSEWRDIWICPKCKVEQYPDNWCGKNLTCVACNETSYYKEWIIK